MGGRPARLPVVRLPTDQSGAFRIRGLWRGPHDVFVLLPDVPFPEEAARRVDAPARDVRIDLDPPVAVELDVEAGGRPAPRAGLEFVVGDGKTVYVVTASTEEDGTWRQTLAPGRTVRVTVTLAGFEPASLEFRTGGPGTQIQRRVVLSPSASASNLVVRLTGPDAAAVRSCWFHLERLDAPAVPPSVETGPGDIAPPTPLPVASGPEDRTETPAERDEAGNAVYRLADLAAGRYRLVVRPEASLMGETGFHVPDVRTVDLPPGGEALVDSEARLGGRLRVAARDESGRLLEASCRVLDARGEPQEVEFLTYGTDVSMRRGGRLGPYSPSTVVPPLLPGRYTLEFALDDRFLAARTVEVLVEAGRTTDVDVTLTP